MNVLELIIVSGKPYNDRLKIRVRGRFIYFDVDVDGCGQTFRTETGKIRNIIKRVK